MEKGLRFVQLAGALALAFVLFSETVGVKSPVLHAAGFLGSLVKAGCARSLDLCRIIFKVDRPTGRPPDLPDLPDLQPLLQSELKLPAERPGGLTPSYI